MFTHFLNVFAALACYRNTKKTIQKIPLLYIRKIYPFVCLYRMYFIALSLKTKKCASLLSDLRTISYNLKKLLFFAVFSPFSCRN